MQEFLKLDEPGIEASIEVNADYRVGRILAAAFDFDLLSMVPMDEVVSG